MDKFKVSATGHLVNFFPLYLAQRQGFFEELGLDVEWRVPYPWEEVLTDVDSRGYDTVLGGLRFPAIFNQLKIKQYRAYCNLCSRAISAGVSRVDPGPFDWKWFEGKQILDTAFSYKFTVDTLKQHGVDLSKVRFLTDWEGPTVTKFFFHGLGDVLFTKYTDAKQYVKQGKAYLCFTSLVHGEPLPNSEFFTPPELLEKNPDLYRRFTLGIKKGLLWLQDHSGEESREMLKAEFPNYDLDVCVETVDDYRKHHMWSPSVAIDKKAYSHYMLQQVNFGNLIEPLDYEDMIYLDTIEYADNYFKNLR